MSDDSSYDIRRLVGPHGGNREATGGVRTSDTTTRGIRIQVRSEFVPERSSHRDSQYLFQYHVRISNVGSETAQLVSREWIITNAEGDVERVKGPGVVGEQPVLSPGDAFEYTSFCPLKTPVGSMHGSYRMVTATGEQFDAVIAPFTLAAPNTLN
jgi:ApaG protein